MLVRCNDCGREASLTLTDWRCDCGGAWEPVLWGDFLPGREFIGQFPIQKYDDLLGLEILSNLPKVGAGFTPLVEVRVDDRNVYLKLEYLCPSGSFKDRGVGVMLGQLMGMGATSVVEDSSGNAGASVAAYAARFGLDAEIYVPASTSPAKIHQIGVYGARVIPIVGPRLEAEQAAQGAVAEGRFYASHAYHPAYLVGQSTAAFELWEQLGRRAPDWIILPVAQGGLLISLWMGFTMLYHAGLIPNFPRLVAAQAAQIAPIHHAWQAGLDHIPAVTAKGPTVAEGIAISQPVRGKRILQALTESEGRTVAVEEAEILEAQAQMAHLGYYVEPTSAVAFAAYLKLIDEIDPYDIVVIPLTGNGLKSPAR